MKDVFTNGTLLFAQRYVLISSIGSGKNAEIWLAYDRTANQYYAIKVQKADSFNTEEIDVLKVLDHPNCIELVNHFLVKAKGNKYACLVFPICAGSLGSVLDAGRYEYGLPLETVKRLTKQMLEGLAHIHSKNLVHADIKTDNILLYGISEQIEEDIRLFEETGFIQASKKIKDKRKLLQLARQCTDIFYEEDVMSDSEDCMGTANDDRDQSVEDESCLVEGVHDLDAIYPMTDVLNLQYETEDHDIIIPECYVHAGTAIIADFGNAMFLDDLTSHEIQDRLYRAPEIILDLPYDSSCDIWSVGCCVFELLTGYSLMCFKDCDIVNDDLQQLYLMQKLIGPIPEHMKQKSPRGEYLFDPDRDNEIRGVASHETIGLREILVKRHLYADELSETVRFLMRLLSYENRPSAKDLLQDPWFEEN